MQQLTGCVDVIKYADFYISCFFLVHTNYFCHFLRVPQI